MFGGKGMCVFGGRGTLCLAAGELALLIGRKTCMFVGSFMFGGMGTYVLINGSTRLLGGSGTCVLIGMGLVR